jgi:hypothetical protein
MEGTITIKASYLKSIIDERNDAQAQVKELKYKLGKDSRNLGHQLTSIEKRFQENMINTMGSEFEDENYNNMY